MAKLASLLWKRFETPNLERYRLEAREDSFTLDGDVVLTLSK